MVKYKQMIWLLFFSIVSSPAYSAGLEPCRGGILISKEIKPFVQMVEAVENNLDLSLCRIFFDDHGNPYSLDSGFKDLNAESWDFIIAVGPAALKYLVEKQIQTQVFYGMVLNPDQILADNSKWCGVSLNLFTPSKIRTIKQVFPGINRLALLYNPDENQMAEKILSKFELVKGIEPVPIKVFSESDIPAALKKAVKKADAFYFIPDRTVISPPIVRHIIKYGISHGIPSIGYNKFFHNTGALLTFTVDYGKIGQQVAVMVTKFINSGDCVSSMPETTLLHNSKVSDVLKIEVREELLNND